MNIVQTINYIESTEHLQAIFDLLSKTKVNGIRINLCKYDESTILEKAEMIKTFLVNNEIAYDIYLDIPYPKNKARICAIKGMYHILRNHKYLITNSYEIFAESKTDVLLLNADQFSIEIKKLYYGDGEGGFRVLESSNDYIIVEAINDFDIIIGKSILCGYKQLSKKCIKNLIQIISGCNQKCYFLLSFVESGEEIRKLRNWFEFDIHLVSKIETLKAIDNLASIVHESNGILEARGDLGLNVAAKDYYKSIIAIEKHTLKQEKELIVCTDVLKTMKNRILPNRAELFDICHSVECGASTIIFSGGDHFNFENINDKEKESVEMINNKIEMISMCLGSNSD